MIAFWAGSLASGTRESLLRRYQMDVWYELLVSLGVRVSDSA